MTSQLVERYLQWLAPQIRSNDDGNPGRSYFGLIGMMFEKQFVEIVPHDDNRMVDGLDLRMEFCRESGLSPEVCDQLGPCSFLEVLIALSRRMEFNAGGAAPGWAWMLITNLELHRMWDPLGRTKARKVGHILDRCVRREYEPNGQGGFFPLAWPDEDQTKVEIWYQMAAWVDELDAHRRARMDIRLD